MVADFELADFQGKAHRLTDWRDRRLVAVVFLGAECPVAELYADTLTKLAAHYEPRGVAFVGIAPNRRDTPAKLAHFASTHRIGFPLLHDVGGTIAARLGATRTPEAVVLDDQRAIRYRGRVDDQYAVGSRRIEVTRRDLAAALDDLLASGSVRRPETEAVGCPIDRPNPQAASPELTYSRDIAPILQRRCVGCHSPGQVGPFSLTSYPRAAAWAGAMAEAVEDGRMPPWHADPSFGRFANDARLTAREKTQLVEWADAGAPEGDPASLPPPIAETDGWRIGEPDLVVSMRESFTIPAQGVVDYQYFEVDPGFQEDRWVRGVEIRPGNRKVVHHCNVFLKDPTQHEEVTALGELGSYCLAATTPGSPPVLLPAGMAKRVPAHWRFVFVVHYAPIGSAQVDQTSMGLLFADPSAVKKEVATNLMAAPDLRIPAHAADHVVERSRRFDDDVLLLALFPHMHLRGKSFRYEAVYPGGRTETLLSVPRYDFQWQNRYELAEPKRLPAGTVLRCIAHYDNSSGNPANPNPGSVVLAGKQSWEEMFNGYYDVALADQDMTNPLYRFRTMVRKSVRSPLLFAAACGFSILFLRLTGHRRTAIGSPDRRLGQATD